MTEVILQPNVITPGACRCALFYGILMGRERGYVTYYDCHYRVTSINTGGGDWGHGQSKLETLITYLLQNGAKVYEFETAAELCRWLYPEELGNA